MDIERLLIARINALVAFAAQKYARAGAGGLVKISGLFLLKEKIVQHAARAWFNVKPMP